MKPLWRWWANASYKIAQLCWHKHNKHNKTVGIFYRIHNLRNVMLEAGIGVMTSYYIPHYVWYVSTCLYPWYMLLPQHSWYTKKNIFKPRYTMAQHNTIPYTGYTAMKHRQCTLWTNKKSFILKCNKLYTDQNFYKRYISLKLQWGINQFFVKYCPKILNYSSGQR